MSMSNAAVSIQIETDKPGPVINKNIYGQFAEHLGRGGFMSPQYYCDRYKHWSTIRRHRAAWSFKQKS